MVLIFQLSFVKSNQQQIIKITISDLEFRDNRDLQFPLALELVAQQSLTGAVIIILFCHIETS